jgi:hypothetical protein
VLVDLDRRYVLEVAAEHHPMTAEGPLIHPQAVLDQHANVERIDYATASGVALLHRDDFLDVLNVAAQRRQFRGGCITLADEIRGKLLQIGRQVLTLSTRQEGHQVVRVLAQQRSGPREPGALRFLDALCDQACRDVHAVEYVADVVQDIGGHFRHARLPRCDEQLLVYLLELLFSEAPFGDVLDHRHRAECLCGRSDQPPRA